MTESENTNKSHVQGSVSEAKKYAKDGLITGITGILVVFAFATIIPLFHFLGFALGLLAMNYGLKAHGLDSSFGIAGIALGAIATILGLFGILAAIVL